MKRISLFAAVTAAALCSTASVAVASPNGAHGSARISAVTKTSFEVEYNAEAYYGAVKCTGTDKVSKKFPGGKEVEICITTEGQLKRVVAGKGQKEFENSEGGKVAEWESDSGDGKKTTNYTYNVNGKLTKLKIIAIYPEEPPA
jgi:hypothetical protein